MAKIPFHFISALLTALIFSHPMGAHAAEPVTIAVLDSPVDYSHTEIADHIDLELMKRLSIANEEGGTESWFDLNQQEMGKYRDRLGTRDLADQIKFLTALGEISLRQKLSKRVPSALMPLMFKALGRGFLKYLFSPGWKKQIDIVGQYLHGTHVAGIALNQRSGVRLITYPMVRYSETSNYVELLTNYDPEKSRRETREKFERISQGLREAGGRVVVNMSIEFSGDVSLRNVLKKLPLWRRVFQRGRLREIMDQDIAIALEEYRRFFRSNPDIIFVVAAGNGSMDLETDRTHSAAINEPNVINVGAIDANDLQFKMASFSNTGANDVEIAAPGAAVSGPRVGGGSVRLSGTSMATPIVTNRLAYIWEQDPTKTPTQVIQELYSVHSVTTREINAQVIAGRYLLPLFEVVAGRAPNDQDYAGLLRLMDQDRYSCESALKTEVASK